MQINIYKNFSSDLIKNWLNLEKNSYCTPFQSLEWHKTWFENIGKALSLELYIITVKIEENIIAIFPFCLKKKFFINYLIWLGGLQTDYNMPLIEKNYFNNLKIVLIWNEIKKNIKGIDLIYLEKLPEYILKNFNLYNSNLNNLKYQSNSFRVIFNKSWDEYYNNINIKFRNDNNRQIKRLKKIGNMNFCIANTIEDKLKIIKIMIIQKSHRYVSTNSWDMFSLSYNKNFYLEIVKNLNNIGKIHCSYLKIDNEIIATHIGIVSNDCFYYILPTFDSNKFGKFSPGKILLEFLLKWSFENNIKLFDFTVGNEKYKKNWANNSFIVYNSLNSITVRGNILIFINFIIFNVKKIPFLKSFIRNIINFSLKK